MGSFLKLETVIKKEITNAQNSAETSLDQRNTALGNIFQFHHQYISGAAIKSCQINCQNIYTILHIIVESTQI